MCKTNSFKATSRMNKCIKNVFESANIHESKGNDWNIIWSNGIEKDISSMNKYQKCNHFSESINIGRKDNIWKNLSRVKSRYPKEYDFIPKIYLLQSDSDWEKFILKRLDIKSGQLWILNPINEHQGYDFTITQKISKDQLKYQYKMCEYNTNPHLIDGFQYNLRIYVLVTSYDPLRVYIFKEGLVRFSKDKYITSPNQIGQMFLHLTNFAGSTQIPYLTNFSQKSDVTNEKLDTKISFKWSLKALFERYESMDVNIEQLWESIKDVVVKTCIAIEPQMNNQLIKSKNPNNNCFELQGFDIMVDNDFKPWLLSVQMCPSLESSTLLEQRIKRSLICDTLNLIGLQPFDKKKYIKDRQKQIQTVSCHKNVVSKFIRDVTDINQYNCIEKITTDDWNMLLETDEENHRTGNFSRIFPPHKDQIDFYLKFFEHKRYSNHLIRSWMFSKSNFLLNVFKQIHYNNV